MVLVGGVKRTEVCFDAGGGLIRTVVCDIDDDVW